MAGKEKLIVDAWNQIQDDDPDISTERLLMMVCDKCGCEDISEVVDALIATGVLEPENPTP